MNATAQGIITAKPLIKLKSVEVPLVLPNSIGLSKSITVFIQKLYKKSIIYDFVNLWISPIR